MNDRKIASVFGEMLAGYGSCTRADEESAFIAQHHAYAIGGARLQLPYLST